MSEQQVRSLYKEAEDFSRQLVAKGWLDNQRMTASEMESPSDLFAIDGADRPLVVGLFGGTGVGKSSLLNRLAGSEVARTGVVRPTSMEITAYLHRDKQISSLPEGFPRDQFSEVHHSNEKFSDVMWVDMPDFDSEETQNRDQVLKWLPHIDLLLYVVTPERYKDEEGWRLLLENGYGHAWLFIMNQWDRAQDGQLNDFRNLLHRAGFDSPRVYRTVCLDSSASNGEDKHSENEFDQLADFVSQLAERNIIAQLDRRGWLHRLNLARSRLDDQISILGGVAQQAPLPEEFDRYWAEFSASVRNNLDLPFKEYSKHFAEEKSAPLTSVYKSITGNKNTTGIESRIAARIATQSDVTELWGDWSETRLNDVFVSFELADTEHGVPMAAFSNIKEQAIAKTSAEVKSQLRLQLDHALHNPGPSWQRAAVLVVSWLQWLLPLAAAGWVGYRIVSGFIDGAVDKTAYVGLDFLVNGLLLIAIAWVVPWVLTRLLKPSIPKSVVAGLQQGLGNGLEPGAKIYRAKLENLETEKTGLIESAVQLRKRISKVADKSSVLENPALKGMLLKDE